MLISIYSLIKLIHFNLNMFISLPLDLFQKELIESPDKGDLIQKTGGLRKIRMATGNQGKSGSARVIYFLATAEVIYLVMAYPKSTKDSLTDAEKAELKKLTQRLKDEV